MCGDNAGRGVQYVRCVIRKCVMVKAEGKRKTHKICKKTRKYYEIRGEHFKK